ncbi:uncharacterized protein LOC127847767 isoform X2 [Dreissena polymorpha]|uniref:uncharacterized protein LOC127847767 isoform X2 n=1 Tax=Dreissena polymorpha TaxID=45954 RepID=UPI0022646099|nr:uncharacterized protein LOC127847767 isoform X2 [Dreissena polymorpha]XP_052235859.1 uncharacterized protein LOC127847767 isoform X2 [Dreissena polymorpha]XP_052235861.1 uncharacterized protein LOC127847767 isoform X2 [Dreissena polymorpha]XP_052235862.1 uncharacterized protein LOC127847767 isoform X2 [Dreissena polymorpha]XP_052235863.1 uncharacterized protein LOC127847767 isoform X2 [Dreissena polymorpha]
MDLRKSVWWTLTIVLCELSALNCGNVVPQAPPTNNYTVTDGKVTCVVMTAGIRLAIPYVTDTKNETVNITIPQNGTTYGGMCSKPDGTNQLNINFLDNWNLTFIFANSSTLNNSYEWQLVILNYIIDSSYFPNATNLGKHNLTLTFPNGTNAAQFNGSYRCDRTRDIPLSMGVTMTMMNLSYRAFGSDSHTDISSETMASARKLTSPWPWQWGLLSGRVLYSPW